MNDNRDNIRDFSLWQQAKAETQAEDASVREKQNASGTEDEEKEPYKAYDLDGSMGAPRRPLHAFQVIYQDGQQSSLPYFGFRADWIPPDTDGVERITLYAGGWLFQIEGHRLKPLLKAFHDRNLTALRCFNDERDRTPPQDAPFIERIREE